MLQSKIYLTAVSGIKPIALCGRIFFTVCVLLCLISSNVYAVKPIKVGIATSLTGKYGQFGTEQFRGVKMWVEDINERGALLGRPVELIVYDNQSQREVCAELYQKLIVEDKVDLLIGPYSSGMSLAARPIVEQFNFPMLVEGTAPSIWAQGINNMFGFLTPSEKSMVPVISMAASKGYKRVALAYANTDFPIGVASGVRAQLEEQGMQLVFDEQYAKEYKTSDEFLPLLTRMKATKPDLVIVASYLIDSIAFTQQAKLSELAPKMFVFSTGPAMSEYADALGKDVEGIMSTVQWDRSQRMPGSFDFSFRFQQKYGIHADYNAAGGYAAGQIIEAAVRLAGTLDKDKIRERLKAMKFRSLIGHFRVDENGRQIGKPNYIIQWQEGERRLIYPNNLARFEPNYLFPGWKKISELE